MAAVLWELSLEKGRTVWDIPGSLSFRQQALQRCFAMKFLIASSPKLAGPNTIPLDLEEIIRISIRPQLRKRSPARILGGTQQSPIVTQQTWGSQQRTAHFEEATMLGLQI